MEQGQHKDVAYFEQLADRLLKGTITPEQRQQLDQWYMEHVGADAQIPSVYVHSEKEHEQVLLEKLKNRLVVPSGKSARHRPLFLWTATAAACLLLALLVTEIFKPANISKTENKSRLTALGDLAPGHAGAVLHLSNGSTLVLDSIEDGTLINQDGIQIVKENGQLKYIGTSDKVVYNDIVTQRGRQWKMTLPDGTEVWLNAQSSLHYPISFKGQKERIVQLTGEAYFKVAHNAMQPFKVLAGKTVIEDIGTAFNVNAYQDEPGIVTTLVEGVVKVDDILLKPGQQASQGSDGQIKLQMVNTSDYTAWVNGQLSLDNVTVKELMRQLSRWYDVDIIYKGDVSNIRLGGLIDKKVYLSDIISVLNAYGIHLKLVDNTLIVSP
ncbi:FecR protein [Arachidicoccus rhizosphaerae]|uniref:FecR protein n=1 Tax=Arachidicoccus rhizosphaerae TaxID=551991 RepID=A0A1H4AXV5_9BACT|nr:FecR family protein [Arachidicoccus rhizosphaerae]SEA40721.1 FecR protein [Arachidicoccus rhizosphaerae]